MDRTSEARVTDFDRRTPDSYPYRTMLQPRFGDMVHMGHVNAVSLCTYYEELRVLFYRTMFDQKSYAPAPDPLFVIINMTVEFVGEVKYPDNVEAACAVTKVGGKSHTLGMALFQRGRCVGLSDQTFVHIIRGGGGPTSMSEVLADRLRSAALGTAPVVPQPYVIAG